MYTFACVVNVIYLHICLPTHRIVPILRGGLYLLLASSLDDNIYFEVLVRSVKKHTRAHTQIILLSKRERKR